MKHILRPLVVAYAGLAILLPAAGLPWPVLAPACLLALLAIGELWLRALAGRPAETGIPAVRAGLAVLTGLLTLPALALLLHALDVRVRPLPLIVAAAVLAAVLGAAGLLRLHLTGRDGCVGDPDGVPRAGWAESPVEDPAAGARTAAAVLLPVLLALAGGTIAVRAVERAPRPAPPGYLTVSLHGWAAGLSHPLAVPARGATVPIRVASSGLPATTHWLRLRVAGTVVAHRRVTVLPDQVYALIVRVPALPPDGCLRAVGISVGPTGTVFYARSAVVRGRTAC
ncbi:hypothetical protein [Actinoplanes teichomyceticus]|uniref:DUF1616 domain-containing protein n=1 Tax=Actinoplanes teichomyceticus TaxID=1867 RepID=A0A561VSS1_ACTTI|nr:hypothetical protein [Actinoplanes teichomyceticus]TWG14657.1 hypothetical protein FHX34_104963 [Actinoplanes teichomyceticus]GIF10059.1 hypothetical protein Ate01nite_00910 [Actinoplanes teichomyceticus]